jgi:hypothetical protein
LGCPHLQLAKGQALVKTNSPRIRIRPERIAAYLTLISAGLGFFDQVRRTNEQVQVRRVINDEVNKAAPNFRAGERASLVIRQQLSYGEVTTWRVELGLRPLMGLEEIKEEMYQQWEEMYERQKTYIIEEEPV